MKKLSTNIQHWLTWAAKAGLNDLYCFESPVILRKVYNKESAPSRIGKQAKKNLERLIEQLPDGIHDNRTILLRHVNASIKKINNSPTTYSPLVMKHKEFSLCKSILYGSGNIITGREKEIEEILLTLCKKDKRGTILVGPAGTGKSSIVRAINSRLIERSVPRELIGCEVLNMDLPYIFSKQKDDPLGAIIRILEKASKYDKAILFIDEVHQLLSQKMNDIMKPYLTEKIRFIGCTTNDEYHSIITNDRALERRFTVVQVEEPSVEQTTNMVIGTKSIYEDHHKCSVPNDICKYIAETGNRFLGNRKNPDKSLDILDVACSILQEKEIKKISDNIELSKDPINNIDYSLKKIKSSRTISGDRTLNKKYVNLAISSLTGINYTDIAESLNYKTVLSKMQSNIIAQDEQMEIVSNVVNIFKFVKNNSVRPISILLFVGPSGVGKYHTAKNLTEHLFNNNNCLISYDMSAFSQEFTLTELRGSPPGYVGYGKSGGLIKKLSNNPQSIVYFRNINKAHRSITNYIIEGCRSGKLLDSTEKEVKLNNSVIIFSVTLSEQEYKDFQKGKNKVKSMGFGKENNQDDKVDNSFIKNIVGDTIFDMCDDVVTFNKLEKKDLEKIYKLNIDEHLNHYNVDIDKKSLKETVLKNADNAHDVISKLSSEIPKKVFKEMRSKI